MQGMMQGIQGTNGMGGMGMGGPLMMIVFLLVSLLVIGAVVWLIVRLVRDESGGGDGAGASRSESAEEILKRRYARGEIDRSTYRRMSDDLEGGPPER